MISELSVNWLDSLGLTVKSKLPGSGRQWRKSGFAFLGICILSLLTAVLVRSKMAGQGTAAGVNPWKIWVYFWGAMVCPGLWAAYLVCPYPENEIFFHACILSGILGLLLTLSRVGKTGARSFHTSSLMPLFYLYAGGTMAQLSGMPLQILTCAWPLGMTLMMIFLFRQIRSNPAEDQGQAGRVYFWCGLLILGGSLAGFTFPSMEAFSLIFLSGVLYQSASAVTGHIQGKVTLLQEQGDTLFHLILVSLGIPLVWTGAGGLIMVWITDQFGGERMMDWAGRLEFTWKDIHVGLIQLFLAVILFFVAKTVSRVLKMAADSMSGKFQVEKRVMAPLKSLAGYGVWGIYGLAFLHIIGVRLSSIVVLAGGISVGVGFGLQHIINNFISGLILLFGRTVHHGDVVEHENVVGEVENVTILNTMIRTRQDTAILVPNSNLVSMPLVNMSRGGRAVRLSVPVGVCYESDTGVVTELLEQIAGAHPEVLAVPKPRAHLEDFGAAGLHFNLKFWVTYTGTKRVASELRFAIVKEFREHGIEICVDEEV